MTFHDFPGGVVTLTNSQIEIFSARYNDLYKHNNNWTKISTGYKVGGSNPRE